MSATRNERRGNETRVERLAMSRQPWFMRTVDLGPDQILPIEQAHPEMRVRVLYGRVWLTEEGGGQDVIASSGDEVALRSRGLAVIEALGLARVQVLDTARAPLAVRIAESGSRLFSELRRLAGRTLVRLHLGPRIARR